MSIIYILLSEGKIMTSTAIKIDNNIVDQAKTYGKAESRSATKQVEYWAKIGKIAQDNPDLTYDDITDLLLGMAQVKSGMTTPYNFG
nr:ParD-like family protein [Acinetobacter harbinensis]